VCIEEGFFYAADLEARDPSGFSALREYCSRHFADTAPGFPRRLTLMSVDDWLESRFRLYAYRHRRRCSVVGYNLPFDLGRVARYWSPAGGYYRGGFSLGLWGDFDNDGRWHDRRYCPRLVMKAIDPRRTLFGWGSVKDRDLKIPELSTRFVDLHTLVFALTDRNVALDGKHGACALFGEPYIKKDVEYGVVDEAMLDYARDDVRYTVRLYNDCLTELDLHVGVALEPHRLYSPATVGTRYMEAMGVEQPLLKFTNIDPSRLGWKEQRSTEPSAGIDLTTIGRCTSAFFGGRAEGRVVRVPLCPVGLVDAQSMYSLVNANLGTWQLLTARELSIDDCTEQVRQVLDDPRLIDRCLERQFWKDTIGVTFVELDAPDGVRLPVRAAYDPRSTDPGIGVNPIRYDGRLWYMLGDVVAGVILGAPIPTVSRAHCLVSLGTQDGLRPVALRGGRTIDPTTDDPFVVMVEERQRIKADPEIHQAQRDRLDRFLKITGSATAYGVLARFDRREIGEPIELTVYGPDETPLSAKTTAVEEPGPFCFPPIAAAITAGARLMLALLERLVHDEGGSYAFCDTDSMAIICSPAGGWLDCPTPDGAARLRVLPWPTVQGILGRFADLNPFDPTLVPSLWKVEHDSLTRELCCYVISAKRYILYRVRGTDVDLVSVVDDEADTDDGSPVDSDLVDWSEHGLGLYLDPTGDVAKGGLRDGEGRRTWIREAWTWVLRRALGGEPEFPAWANLPAVTRFTISKPTVAAWFAGRDAGLAWSHRMRPGSFGLIAHPDPFLAAASGQPLPAAPFETDPHRWLDLPWYDRRTGKPIRITTTDPATDPERLAAELATGDVRVRTLGDVLHDYARRPEHKSLAPDGSPVTGATVGKLRPRPVESHPALTILTGKEGNKLLERLSGEVTDPAEYRSDFGPREDPWRSLVVPVLRAMGAAAAAEAVGCSRRAVERAILEGEATMPHGATKARLVEVAAGWARTELGAAAPAGDAAGLYALLQRKPRTRICGCGCGRELQPGQRIWWSEVCRKRVARRTTRKPRR